MVELQPGVWTAAYTYLASGSAVNEELVLTYLAQPGAMTV